MNEIYVTRSSMPTIDEYIDEIKDLWDNHILTNMGYKHQKFQKMIMDYLEVPGVELMSNGHMSLELSIQALLSAGDMHSKYSSVNNAGKMEIITTPFTFASTTHAIVRNGFEPIFCDINPIDYTIDVNKIEDLITDRTVAILPVHVYGNVCDVNRIQELADRYGLKVIYDAAHAFGEKLFGKNIANYGDVSCFSFHATKVFNTIEGGAVAYKDTELGRQLYRLKNFGIRNEDVVDGIGANAKMNEFCAAMGICNLRHLKDEINKRKIVTEKYDELLLGIEGITIRRIQEGVESNYSYYPIVVDEKIFGKTRNDIYDLLKREGIYSRKYFYPLTNMFDCFQGKYDLLSTPNALHISKRVLTLPLYSDLKSEDIERICKIILR